MSGLTLNFKGGLKKPTKKPGPARTLNAFGGGNSDDEDEDVPQAGVFGKKVGATGNSKTAPVVKKDKSRDRVNAQLATFNELAKKAAEVQPEVDEAVYDYDGAYDEMKKAKERKKLAQQEEAAQGKPKYMEKLLEAAELRKQDHLRAKEKKLVREREEEGDEFADKEKFVTEAYKKQQEELKKLEEEEKAREGMSEPQLFHLRSLTSRQRRLQRIAP